MTEPLTAIAHHKYANITTFRRNGEAKKTPIWFAVRDGKAYLWTNAYTWKVKRIKNDPRCALTPCDVRGKTEKGPTVPGVARLLSDASEIARAKAAFRQKYGLGFAFGELFGRLRPGSQHVYLEITAGEGA